MTRYGPQKRRNSKVPNHIYISFSNTAKGYIFLMNNIITIHNNK